MTQLAIIGHPTRGKEVIELLEMLGGKNPFSYDGTFKGLIYTIGSELELDVFNVNCSYGKDGYIVFTLEEFLEKYPYKVGDKVNYVKYNDEYQNVYTIQKVQWTGATIEYLLDSNGFSALTKDLQPYKEETMEEKNNNWAKWDLPDGYEFQDEEGNVIKSCIIRLVKKQSQYPKTYKECCEVLDWNHRNYDRIGYKSELLCKLQVLLLCRDAYWKIAGEQMGLDKPWEPDWGNASQTKYCITVSENNICLNYTQVKNRILTFPTEEMRDAFYKNFKDLIEVCKELL